MSISGVEEKPGATVREFNLAWDMIKAGRADAAVVILTDFIGVDDKSPEVWYARAFAYFKTGRYKEAVKDANETILMAPKDREAYVVRAMAHYRLGQNRRCLNDLERAETLEPFTGTRAVMFDILYEEARRGLNVRPQDKITANGRN